MDELYRQCYFTAMRVVQPAAILAIFATTSFISVAQAPAMRKRPIAASHTLRFHKRAALVTLSLRATDRRGHPVLHLRRRDFTVLENGQPQRLVLFQPAWRSGPPRGKSSPASFAYSSGLGFSRTIRYVAFVVDERQLTPRARMQTVKTLRHYSRNLDGRQRWALFALRHHIRLLQLFTARRKKFLQGVARLLHDRIRPGTFNRDNLIFGLNDCRKMIPANTQCGIAEADTYTEQANQSVRQELAQLEELMRFIGAFPGEKRLVYFGDGFSLNPGRLAADLADAYGAGSSMTELRLNQRPDLRPLESAAVRYRVTLDMIDARGLQAPYPGGIAPGRPRPGMASPVLTSELNQTRDLGMLAIAGATGGRAFWQSNDLGSELRRAIGTRKGLYLAAYSPADTRSDGKFRKITLRIYRHGLKIQTRKGYYALPLRRLPVRAQVLPQRQIQQRWYKPLLLILRNQDLQWQGQKDELLLFIHVAGMHTAFSYHRLWLVPLKPGPEGETRFATALHLSPGNYLCSLRVAEPSSGRERDFALRLQITPKR